MNLTTEEMESFLKRRGWRELNVSHPWRWQRNLPAQYRLQDAFALELARKAKHLRAQPPRERATETFVAAMHQFG
jgi:hypothetical protein